ncbi:hypothetical protein ASF48_07345 [Rathayibacter sp. Leaf299]|uniref:hypothetical protein n=1 Tax=unclassified Rathayibacter TaxID=2609250 RepID=UPI0006F67D61|nr:MULTISPECIES: hypothetical protein [unclassified Rathayibacter]KQQ22936.1 hypothetical protein ASF48_07345 [Rathayibacter sp. Leaf299]
MTATRQFRPGFVVASSAVLLLAAGVVAGLPLYVFPVSDDIDHVDVVVVLGPIDQERLWTAEWLIDHGRADALVLSVPPDGSSVTVDGRDYCASTKLCFIASPSTTRGEVSAVEGIARREGWTDIAYVTGTAHVSRARWIAMSCSTRSVAVVEARENRNPAEWLWSYVYQTAGFLKAAVVGCLDD